MENADLRNVKWGMVLWNVIFHWGWYFPFTCGTLSHLLAQFLLHVSRQNYSAYPFSSIGVGAPSFPGMLLLFKEIFVAGLASCLGSAFPLLFSLASLPSCLCLSRSHCTPRVCSVHRAGEHLLLPMLNLDLVADFTA